MFYYFMRFYEMDLLSAIEIEFSVCPFVMKPRMIGSKTDWSNDVSKFEFKFNEAPLA